MPIYKCVKHYNCLQDQVVFSYTDARVRLVIMGHRHSTIGNPSNQTKPDPLNHFVFIFQEKLSILSFFIFCTFQSGFCFAVKKREWEGERESVGVGVNQRNRIGERKKKKDRGENKKDRKGLNN
jgi:hypothetical protein